MIRIVCALLLLFLLSSADFAQSGRKAVATPKPTPVAIDPNDSSQYSESKPRPPRTVRKTERPATASPRAQSTPSAPNIPDSDDGEILKVETNLITIPVSVFDRNGLYVASLRQQDFRIFEDGVEQEIAYFGKTDKPFTVALVLDTSPSTVYMIDEIHRAAAAFVNQLQPQDRVMVIEFNNSVKVLTEATSNRNKIYEAINKAKFGYNTCLYNAVGETLRKHLPKIEGRKAIVLFTDGVDTDSRKNTYDGTLSYAEEADVLIFPIYFNTYFENRQRVGSTSPEISGGPVIQSGVSAEEYALGKRYLEDLADVTGGRVFRPESTPGGLTAAFEGIAEELRRQYSIGYIPKEEGRSGQRKQIKIRVNKPNLVIRTRDSYIVGAAAIPVLPAK